jgi:hypothetical protein
VTAVARGIGHDLGTRLLIVRFGQAERVHLAEAHRIMSTDEMDGGTRERCAHGAAIAQQRGQFGCTKSASLLHSPTYGPQWRLSLQSTSRSMISSLDAVRANRCCRASAARLRALGASHMPTQPTDTPTPDRAESRREGWRGLPADLGQCWLPLDVVAGPRCPYGRRQCSEGASRPMPSCANL